MCHQVICLPLRFIDDLDCHHETRTEAYFIALQLTLWKRYIENRVFAQNVSGPWFYPLLPFAAPLHTLNFKTQANFFDCSDLKPWERILSRQGSIVTRMKNQF